MKREPWRFLNLILSRSFIRLLPFVGAVIAVSTIVAIGHARTPPTRHRGEMTWTKITLDKEFRSEGVAVGDVNHDGKPDVLAGSFWYEAPNWTQHELAPVEKFDAAHGYSKCFLSWAADVNGDGWVDQIVVGFPGAECIWRENPRNQPGHWKEHIICKSACNESPAYGLLLGGKKPVLVFPFDESQMAWYEPGSDPTAEWTKHIISEPKAPGTQRFSHGMGIGDINGDGRADVLCKDGYWEAPKDRRTGPWKWVPCKLGPDCAQMYVYDVNGDGLPDVISSSAHNIVRYRKAVLGAWTHGRCESGRSGRSILVRASQERRRPQMDSAHYRY